MKFKKINSKSSGSDTAKYEYSDRYEWTRYHDQHGDDYLTIRAGQAHVWCSLCTGPAEFDLVLIILNCKLTAFPISKHRLSLARYNVA